MPMNVGFTLLYFSIKRIRGAGPTAVKRPNFRILYKYSPANCT